MSQNELETEKMPKKERSRVVKILHEFNAITEEDLIWDKLLKEHPEPMREMADWALKSLKAGKVKSFP